MIVMERQTMGLFLWRETWREERLEDQASEEEIQSLLSVFPFHTLSSFTKEENSDGIIGNPD